jgi:predicted dehydrogenase
VSGDRSKIEYGTVDVDDNAAFVYKFANGAIGQFAASHFSGGRKHSYGFELHGEKGSLYFDWTHMNELQYYALDDPKDREGFRTIIMGQNHPYGQAFWPVQGYGIGFTETKIIQMNDFVEAVANKTKPQTDFYDGWKVQQIGDAVVQSVEEHGWVKVG